MGATRPISRRTAVGAISRGARRSEEGATRSEKDAARRHDRRVPPTLRPRVGGVRQGGGRRERAPEAEPRIQRSSPLLWTDAAPLAVGVMGAPFRGGPLVRCAGLLRPTRRAGLSASYASRGGAPRPPVHWRKADGEQCATRPRATLRAPLAGTGAARRPCAWRICSRSVVGGVLSGLRGCRLGVELRLDNGRDCANGWQIARTCGRAPARNGARNIGSTRVEASSKGAVVPLLEVGGWLCIVTFDSESRISVPRG